MESMSTCVTTVAIHPYKLPMHTCTLDSMHVGGWRGMGTLKSAVRATPLPELRSEWVSFEGPKVSILGGGGFSMLVCVCGRRGGRAAMTDHRSLISSEL